jgi:hypothetical protein
MIFLWSTVIQRAQTAFALWEILPYSCKDTDCSIPQRLGSCNTWTTSKVKEGHTDTDFLGEENVDVTHSKMLEMWQDLLWLLLPSGNNLFHYNFMQKVSYCYFDITIPSATLFQNTV